MEAFLSPATWRGSGYFSAWDPGRNSFRTVSDSFLLNARQRGEMTTAVLVSISEVQRTKMSPIPSRAHRGTTSEVFPDPDL